MRPSFASFECGSFSAHRSIHVNIWSIADQTQPQKIKYLRIHYSFCDSSESSAMTHTFCWFESIKGKAQQHVVWAYAMTILSFISDPVFKSRGNLPLKTPTILKKYFWYRTVLKMIFQCFREQKEIKWNQEMERETFYFDIFSFRTCSVLSFENNGQFVRTEGIERYWKVLEGIEKWFSVEKCYLI